MKVMVTILKVNKARAKRGFSLEKVMTKLSETSTTTIAITFLVINLSTLLKEPYLFGTFLEKKLFLPSV